MRELPKQIQSTCARCSVKYYGQKNGKYCIDCKVEVMLENSRKNKEKNKDKIKQQKKDRAIIMKGL